MSQMNVIEHLSHIANIALLSAMSLINENLHSGLAYEINLIR